VFKSLLPTFDTDPRSLVLQSTRFLGMPNSIRILQIRAVIRYIERLAQLPCMVDLLQCNLVVASCRSAIVHTPFDIA